MGANIHIIKKKSNKIAFFFKKIWKIFSKPISLHSYYNDFGDLTFGTLHDNTELTIIKGKN